MNALVRIICLAVPLFVITPGICSGQDSLSHRAAAIELLTLANTQKTLEQSVETALTAQLKANPSLVPYEDIMRSFMLKYMSWDYLKDKLVAIYVKEFTEDEIRALLAFYRTDVGRKAIEKMPSLFAQGAELGQAAVQEHLPELAKAVQKRAEELKQKENTNENR